MRAVEKDDYQQRLYEKLGEFRKRLVYCLIYFIVAFVIGFIFADDMVEHLKSAAEASQLELHVFAMPDALAVFMKMAFLIGAILSFPFILYQVWAIVKPGLKEKERKIALRFIPIATLLFIVGLSFAYFILFPMVVHFMVIMTTTLQAEEMFGLTQYINFMFSIVIPFGILFELPVIIVFLTQIKVLNPTRLAKMRKPAYFVLIVTAIMITPPEIISDIMVIAPLLLLYELSVWLSKRVYRRQAEEDEKDHLD